MARQYIQAPAAVDMLKAEYRVQDIIDYSSLEYDDLFLEGTGAMVLDHIARIAYTTQSNRARLAEVGREIIKLDRDQIAVFAGNAIELSTQDGRRLAISTRAAKALRDEQKAVIEKTTKIAELSVPAIELAGDSVRCMLAGIHLSRRYEPDRVLIFPGNLLLSCLFCNLKTAPSHHGQARENYQKTTLRELQTQRKETSQCQRYQPFFPALH